MPTTYASDEPIKITSYGDKIIVIEAEKNASDYTGTVTVKDVMNKIYTVSWKMEPRKSGKYFSLRDAFASLFDQSPVPSRYLDDMNREIQKTIEDKLTDAIKHISPELVHEYLMKHLFVTRHGYYLGDALSPSGRKGVEWLAAKMKEITGKDKIKVISSPKKFANRAYESAQIIVDGMGCGEILEDIRLFTQYDDTNRDQLNAIDDLCSCQYGDIDGLALVTHGPVVHEFSTQQLKRRFDSPLYINPVDPGEGIYINLHNGEPFGLGRR